MCSLLLLLLPCSGYESSAEDCSELENYYREEYAEHARQTHC
jgi:hypothetical protein